MKGDWQFQTPAIVPIFMPMLKPLGLRTFFNLDFILISVLFNV